MRAVRTAFALGVCAALLSAVWSCSLDGGINPQPLPPGGNAGEDFGDSTGQDAGKGSGSDDGNAPPVGGADAGQENPNAEDGGIDLDGGVELDGDAGDGGDAGDDLDGGDAGDAGDATTHGDPS